MRTKCNKRKIKGQKGVKTKFGLSFLGKQKRVEEERRREEEEEEEEKIKMYGTCMETMIFVGIIGLLDF